MILQTQELQESCKTILYAISSESLNTITDMVQIDSHNGTMEMSISNTDYFVRVAVPVSSDEELHATVLAKVFLSLISKTDKDEIELTVSDSALIVKGNGVYEIPLVTDDNGCIFQIPEIVIDHVENTGYIRGDVLTSIYAHNTKQFDLGVISKPVQRMYYIDTEGCITFTTGACVNKFEFPTTRKLLLNQKLVKLFKLFGKEEVTVTVGQDSVGSIQQNKVKFENDYITITAITNSDVDMIGSVPATAIRNRAWGEYDHNCVVDTKQFTNAISRLLLFNTNNILMVGTFEFSSDCLTVSKGKNHEPIKYAEFDFMDTYKCDIDLVELYGVLSACDSQLVTISFGDGQAIVIKGNHTSNVVPEVVG